MPAKHNKINWLEWLIVFALCGLAYWGLQSCGCAPIHLHIGGTYHCDKQIPNSGLVITIPEPENKDDDETVE